MNSFEENKLLNRVITKIETINNENIEEKKEKKENINESHNDNDNENYNKNDNNIDKNNINYKDEKDNWKK